MNNRGAGWKTQGPVENIPGGKYGVWWEMQGLHALMLFSHMTCTIFTIIQRGETLCQKKGNDALLYFVQQQLMVSAGYLFFECDLIPVTDELLL